MKPMGGDINIGLLYFISVINIGTIIRLLHRQDYMIATTLICITVVTLIISTSLPKKNIVGAISIYTITFEALMFFTKIGDMALIINMTQIASLMLVKYGGQEKVKMEIIDMVLLIIAVIATVSLDTYITAINFGPKINLTMVKITLTFLIPLIIPPKNPQMIVIGYIITLGVCLIAWPLSYREITTLFINIPMIFLGRYLKMFKN